MNEPCYSADNCGGNEPSKNQWATLLESVAGKSVALLGWGTIINSACEIKECASIANSIALLRDPEELHQFSGIISSRH